MSDTVLKINMLGTFSLEWKGQRIACDINRSRRIWMLLAYIFYHGKRVISPNELLDLFWNDEKDRSNPAGALKAAMHRGRAILRLLDEEVGPDMIIYGNGGYRINPALTVELDTELFEASYKNGDCDLALRLYKGEFLAKLSSDAWSVPIAAYFRNLYLQTLQKRLPELYEEGRFEDGVAYCREALLAEPYEEMIYRHLMRNLLALDRRAEAIELYDEFSKILMANFGVVPSPESRQLYKEALRTVNHYSVHPDTVSEQLRESGPVEGALLCDYDFFKMLYQAEARLIARSGIAVHIALLSVEGRNKELTRRTLDNAMEDLKEHLHKSFRKGDVISQCSPSQFVVMLPNANFENSCLACKRVIKGFERLKPHSPAKVEVSVQPLIPREECLPPIMQKDS